jgi:hypothetical protein
MPDASTTARWPIGSPRSGANAGRLHTRLKVLTRPALLVVDEIEREPILLVPFAAPAAIAGGWINAFSTLDCVGAIARGPRG